MIETDVLVLGGGFAGFWAALAARAVARARGHDALRVTLVSREPALQLRPRLYEAQPETLAVPLPPLLRRADVGWHEGEVTGIDAAAGRALLSDGRCIASRSLVVTTGSRLRRPAFAGAAQAFSIDTQAEAIALDRRLAEIARTQPEPRLAVVGAGFTGIELALELRDRLALHGGAQAGERAQIVLLDASADPGARIGRAAWSVVTQALALGGVAPRLGVRVRGLDGTMLSLDDGTGQAADVVILATGMEAAPATRWVPGSHDDHGRLRVDAFLRVCATPGHLALGAPGPGARREADLPSATGVWAAGDAAVADDGCGHDTVASCQHALQSGRVAGANAARVLLGQPLVPLRARPYVTCIDLGRYGALFTQGHDRQVLRQGPAAKATKQHINRVLIHPPQEACGDELLAQALPPDAGQARAARPPLTRDPQHEAAAACAAGPAEGEPGATRRG
ncbi:MAG: FAD-dependent oxidoreductase [Rubrivivax sp.]|nr:FAD-dependent oxidoreductase [Rubrivivax sp.]